MSEITTLDHDYGATAVRSSEDIMRKRIVGAIAVIWGFGILLRYVAKGAPPLDPSSYGLGQLLGLGLGVVLLLWGLYDLLHVEPQRAS